MGRAPVDSVGACACSRTLCTAKAEGAADAAGTPPKTRCTLIVLPKYGQKCGLPTPINDRIIEIVGKQQAGELPLAKDNIRLFDDLL